MKIQSNCYQRFWSSQPLYLFTLILILSNNNTSLLSRDYDWWDLVCSLWLIDFSSFKWIPSLCQTSCFIQKHFIPHYSFKGIVHIKMSVHLLRSLIKLKEWLTPYSPVSWLVIAHRLTSISLAFLWSVVTSPVTPKNTNNIHIKVLCNIIYSIVLIQTQKYICSHSNLDDSLMMSPVRYFLCNLVLFKMTLQKVILQKTLFDIVLVHSVWKYGFTEHRVTASG